MADLKNLERLLKENGYETEKPFFLGEISATKGKGAKRGGKEFWITDYDKTRVMIYRVDGPNLDNLSHSIGYKLITMLNERNKEFTWSLSRHWTGYVQVRLTIPLEVNIEKVMEAFEKLDGVMELLKAEIKLTQESVMRAGDDLLERVGKIL